MATVSAGKREIKLPKGIGGYDCKFVEDPPDQLICLICTFVAKDPQQISCCGRIYCKSCLDELKRRSVSWNCPNCRKRRRSFPDIRGDRDVKALKVLCSNTERGCEWTGTLQQLDDHLSSCEFAVYRCPNLCLTDDGKEVFLAQGDTSRHVETECPNRVHQCPHCKQFGKFRKVTGSHLDKCPEVPVSCPNECGTTVARHLLKRHYCECPNQPSTCKFAEIGCYEKPLRKDLEEHENDSKLHLPLAVEAAVVYKKALQKISARGVFKMPEFSDKKLLKETWYSPSFTTHRGGYRMCICVIAAGCWGGRGTHISVFIHLMRGENDDKLIWPFKGEVTVELLNQLEDKNHHRVIIPISEGNDRVIDGEAASWGSGEEVFIPHASLHFNPFGDKKCRYLKDDCLYFRVSADVHEDNYKPWLTGTPSEVTDSLLSSPPALPFFDSD